MVGFSVCNGVLEEGMFRGIFWDALSKVIPSTIFILSLQDAFFGLCHYQGLPSGFVGMGLIFCYGMILDALKARCRGGLAAPIKSIFEHVHSLN